MSTEGFSKSAIDVLIDTFGSDENIERVDDFTLKVLSTEKTFAVTPNEEEKDSIDVWIDDELTETLTIPKNGDEKSNDFFQKELTKHALYVLNI